MGEGNLSRFALILTGMHIESVVGETIFRECSWSSALQPEEAKEQGPGVDEFRVEFQKGAVRVGRRADLCLAAAGLPVFLQGCRIKSLPTHPATTSFASSRHFCTASSKTTQHLTLNRQDKIESLYSSLDRYAMVFQGHRQRRA